MAMVHELYYGLPEFQLMANFLLDLLQTKLFVRVTVKELMEGKENILSHFITKSSLITCFHKGYTDSLIETASLVKPGALRDNKFGILQAVGFLIF